MPEIKHGFVQGKMNKDLNERLIPNGQYRDAMNIQVTSSDGSEVGTVQNILGNKRIDVSGVPSGFTCIGSIADEKNDTIYWFITSTNIDAIIEYKKGLTAVPVFIDTKNVLKFPNRTITGINIVDDFLFWTDGFNEPRKINISRCKQGTISTLADLNGTPIHTKLVIKNELAPLDDIVVAAAADFTLATIITVDDASLLEVGMALTNLVNVAQAGIFIDSISGNDITLNLPITCSVLDSLEFSFLVDIIEDHITVIRKKPTTVLNTKINAGPTTQDINPGLFEKELCRLSYRYKYEDGEYSAFGPFTDVIFNPLYSDNVDQDTIISIKEPYNKAMLNNIESIDVYDFISPDIPEDVIQVDILYKQEESPVVYSIASIKPEDSYWEQVGFNQGKAGYTDSKFKGNYPIVSENVYAAVPANQLLRPWDNVPKKALAQEITGSRIVYGNYTQNYNVLSTPELRVDYRLRNNTRDFDSSGLPSIKSQRNYQLGVIFGDKYGRETPVYTSTEGAIKVPWDNGNIGSGLMASESLQLKAYLSSSFPNWADYYRFYIKETATEYYNLIMDRAYTPTSNIGNIDGSVEDTNHVWVSFPSSDRNKLKEDDYIILKKKVGANETQFPTRNRFKILDIKNEAPEAIKYRYIILGAHSNSTAGTYNGVLDNGGGVAGVAGFGIGIYDSPNQRMDVSGIDIIKINKIQFLAINTGDGANIVDFEHGAGYDKDVFISWKDTSSGTATSGQASQRYQVSDVRETPTTTPSHWVLKLTETITDEDAAIADGTGNQLNTDLIVKVERKDKKDLDEFSGRFFVKVVVDSAIQDPNNITGQLVDGYTVLTEQSSYWWADPENISGDNDPTTGVLNSSSYNASMPNDTQSTSGQNVNEAGTLTGTSTLITSTASGQYVTNVLNWKALKSFHTSKVGGGGFFIDNLTFVAGQCSTNFYAKNAGDPFRGNTTTYGQMTWTNTIDDHPNVPRSHNIYCTPGSGAVIYGDQAGVPETNKNFYPRVLSGQDDDTGDGVVNIWTTAPTADDIVNSNDDDLDVSAFPLADVMGGQNSLHYSNADYGTWRWKPFARDNKDGYVHDTHTGTITSQGWIVNNSTNSIPANQPRMSVGTSVGATAAATGGGFIHALDGIIKTSDEHTAIDGIKRWRANGALNSGSWAQDNTYGSGVLDNDKFYLHLSFLAPGADLVPDAFYTTSLDGLKARGQSSLGTKLQAIWGGGIFTKEDGSRIYGSHFYSSRIMECEGNYTNSYNMTSVNIGPGYGQGYNTGMSSSAGVSYSELHYNQWNPAYPASADTDGKIQEFINNMYQGAKFKFGADTSSEIYTINSVTVKRLYNHTPWRRRKIWDGTALVNGLDSVEEAVIAWGVGGFDSGSAEAGTVISKIKNFAEPNNRRTVYILELDKDPTTSSGAFNPVQGTALLDANSPTGIQFLQSDPRVLSGRVSTMPAIWETEPKKSTDLDIYYEAGGVVPTTLDEFNREIFAPVGCKLEFTNLPEAINGGIAITEDVYLKSWGYGTNVLTFEADPGFNDLDGNSTQIDYTGAKVRFIRQDGSYTTGTIAYPMLWSVNGDYRTHFEMSLDVDPGNEVGLSWYNCFSFGNGIESNRIRDDFNEIQIYNGARASTTTEEPYQEEDRKYGLIFSGLYNSNSGLNDLNQFIMAEKVTKDLNPTYGSIQKLFSRHTDLVTFCEDRVIKVLANKDAVFNADGNPQLTANINVLGQTIPFVGDFGIGKNPESFAKESYRAYFTDKNRGAVLRLSQDGLTPISEAGMHDWFRDNLLGVASLLGTYDEHKKTYNLTLKQAVTENIITNADVADGTAVVVTTTIGSEILTNTTPSGTNLDYSSVLPLDPNNDTGTAQAPHPSYAGVTNPVLNTQPVVKEYPKIPVGFFQAAIAAGTIISDIELITGGDFATDTSVAALNSTGWFLNIVWSSLAGATGLSISNGVLVRGANNGEASGASQTFPIEQGVTYNISYKSRYTGGANDMTYVYIYETPTSTTAAASIVSSLNMNNTATFATTSFTWTATTTGVAEFMMIFAFDMEGEIDDVSVTRSITVPALGELITGGNFATDTSVSAINSTGWYFHADGADPTVHGMSINGGVLARTSGITNSSIRQQIPIESGVTYTISYDSKHTGGTSTTTNAYIDYGSGFGAVAVNSSNNASFFTTTGTFTATTTGIMDFMLFFINDMQGEIDNVSVTPATGIGIPAIPSIEVDAWAEVSTDIIDWTFDQGTITFDIFENTYGLSNPSTLESYTGQILDMDINSLTFGQIISDNNTYSWYTPNPNNDTYHPDDPNNPTLGTAVNYTTPTQTYNYTTSSFDAGTPQSVLDDTIAIDASAVTINMSQALSAYLTTDGWYMLDVAYGTIDTPGTISIEDVLDTSILSTQYPDDSAYPEGHLGWTLGNGEMQLINKYPENNYANDITKQYYDNPNESDPVYRTVFKLDSSLSILKIKFTGFKGQVKGVWLNRIDTLPTATIVDPNWTIENPAYSYLVNDAGVTISTSGQLHSLVLPDKYLKDSKFNFNYSKGGSLEQDLSGTPLLPTNAGYELLFTLEDAVSQIDGTTIPLAGRFYGDVTGEDASGNDTGFKFSSPTGSSPVAGQYRISGNFDGTTTPIAEIYDDGISTWVSGNLTANSYGSGARRIRFGEGNDYLTGAIKNISLKDKTAVFSGGTADAWGFVGNDVSISPYVSFVNETIVFDNAPIGVQANQVITQGDGEAYNIHFDYTLTSGSVDIYYFNTSDNGFRINGLTADGSEHTYDTDHVIGLQTRAGGELTGTFVIVATADNTDMVIDNISMQRVYTLDEETTLSFSEDVRGWISFKSFIPESGVSMSKQYYTFKGGGLYQHHVEVTDATTGLEINRNTFYGTYLPSTVTAVLNEAPSTIKIFNTLNYEGSQSKIQAYASGSGHDGTTLYDIKYYNISSKDGWYVDYLKTDKQEGTIKEFIEKEGKWFNYIRGNVSDIKTSDFSFQGIGTVSNNPAI